MSSIKSPSRPKVFTWSDVAMLLDAQDQANARALSANSMKEAAQHARDALNFQTEAHRLRNQLQALECL